MNREAPEPALSGEKRIDDRIKTPPTLAEPY